MATVTITPTTQPATPVTTSQPAIAVTQVAPAAPSVSAECPICLENLKKMRRVVLTLPCGHVYCRKCIVGYSKEEIQNRTEVLCPNPTCQQVLDLRGLINKKLVIQAKKRSRRPNTCPNLRCIGTVVNFECSICHLRVCQDCGEIQHGERPCNPEIQASYRMVHREARPCPQCQALIYKDGGCSHVHCGRCTTDFDWETLRTHQEIRARAPFRRQPDNLANAWNPTSLPLPEPAPDNQVNQVVQMVQNLQLNNQEPQMCHTCRDRLCLDPSGQCCRCRSVDTGYCQLCHDN